MASLWHWLVFLLILLGSVLIVVGFIRTSHANGGRAKAAADWLRGVWSRLTHKTVHGVVSGTPTSLKMTITGTASASSGPLDASMTIEQKVARLEQMILTHERNSNADLVNIRDVADHDRKGSADAHTALEASLADLRSELIVGLRRTALDGLALAALGAVLVAAGDVLGALLPLVEIG